MKRKYEITDIQHPNPELSRIRALRDIIRFNVKADDLGGYIKHEGNLSHDGDCWISDDACVYDNAAVYGDAQVFENAKVFHNARVFENTKVFGNAQILNTGVCNTGRASIWLCESIGQRMDKRQRHSQ